jgi:hypothetical protein
MSIVPRARLLAPTYREPRRHRGAPTGTITSRIFAFGPEKKELPIGMAGRSHVPVGWATRGVRAASSTGLRRRTCAACPRATLTSQSVLGGRPARGHGAAFVPVLRSVRFAAPLPTVQTKD